MDNLQDNFSNSLSTLYNIIYKLEFIQDIIENVYPNKCLTLSNNGANGLIIIFQEISNNVKNALDEIESAWLALKKAHNQ